VTAYVVTNITEQGFDRPDKSNYLVD